MNTRHKFRKSERLTSRKEIQSLFDQGESFYVFPFRVYWKESELPNREYPVQIAFAVPKRIHKNASTRNRIRRKVREAYRTNKQSWFEQLKDKQVSLAVLLIYTAKEETTYSTVQEKIIRIMHRLQTVTRLS